MAEEKTQKQSKGVTRLDQTRIYVVKLFRLFITERGWRVLIFGAIISFMVSSMIWDAMFVFTMETARGIFSLVSACTWTGIFNSIQSICKEREIIKREHRTGLHITSYVAAHLIYEAAICFLQAAILMVISSLYISYPNEISFFGNIRLEYFITWFLITYASDVMGIAISSVVREPASAMTVMPFVLMLQLMLSGYLLSPPGIGKYCEKATVAYWGLRAGMVSADYNELDNTEVVRLTNSLHKISLDNDWGIPRDKIDVVVREYYHPTLSDLNDHDFSLLLEDWAALCIHTLVYAGIAVLALERIDSDGR